MLEGELTLNLGDQNIKSVPGSCFQVPRGTVHTFATGLFGPARFLGLVIPGGLEDYFDELPKMIEQHGYPPPTDITQALAAKYDFRNVGPPRGA